MTDVCSAECILNSGTDEPYEITCSKPTGQSSSSEKGVCLLFNQDSTFSCIAVEQANGEWATICLEVAKRLTSCLTGHTEWTALQDCSGYMIHTPKLNKLTHLVLLQVFEGLAIQRQMGKQTLRKLCMSLLNPYESYQGVQPFNV